jgi:hypothetical protein
LSSAASFGELVAFFQFFQFLFEVHGGNYKLGIRIRLWAVGLLWSACLASLSQESKSCGASLRRPDEGVWAYVVRDCARSFAVGLPDEGVWAYVVRDYARSFAVGLPEGGVWAYVVGIMLGVSQLACQTRASGPTWFGIVLGVSEFVRDRIGQCWKTRRSTACWRPWAGICTSCRRSK